MVMGLEGWTVGIADVYSGGGSRWSCSLVGMSFSWFFFERLFPVSERAISLLHDDTTIAGHYGLLKRGLFLIRFHCPFDE